MRFLSSILLMALISMNTLSVSAAPGAPIGGPAATAPVIVLSGSTIQTVIVGSGVTLPNVLVETNVDNAFTTGGVAQGWRGDDSDWDYALPFSFTYYGVTYATGYTIKISSNGRICFDNTQSCNATSGNIAFGSYGPQIAPLWRDLYTANSPEDDIYITEDTGSVTFRWQATSCCGPDEPVNFSVTLFANGQIRFDYGDQPTAYDAGNIYQTIGVSSGDEVHYSNSPKASLASYNYISGSLWTYAYGYDDPGATWTDDYDGSGSIVSATSGTVDINTVGTYTIDYTYTNSQGASSTVTRTVNVVPPDSIAPVVTLVGSGNMDIALGATWSDSGATWTDNVDGTGTILSATSGSVDTSTLGTYILEYTKIDALGNTGSTTRTVNVIDMTAPVVTLVGSGTVSLTQGSAYTELGATWSDNVDGTGTLDTTSSGSVNTSVAGTYTLTYSKIDAAGNTGSTTRTVTITAVSSGGGGGGGGSYSSSSSSSTTATTTTTSITPVTTTTTSITPVTTTTTSITPVTTTTTTTITSPQTTSTVITQPVFTNTVATPKKTTTISTTTTLKTGTLVNVYRTLPNGKEIKVGTARVVKGTIKYTVRQSGTYSFAPKTTKKK